jgi:hypothetical protein
MTQNEMKLRRRSPGAFFPPTIEALFAVNGGLRISPNLLKTWWPGTELNRRRQPFQGCSHPSLSSCNPYLYRGSYPHFDRSYWTHNGPNNQTHADTGVRQDSDRANGSLVVRSLLSTSCEPLSHGDRTLSAHPHRPSYGPRRILPRNEGDRPSPVGPLTGPRAVLSRSIRIA